MPHIASIVYTPRGVERKPQIHFARVPLERAMLLEGRGIEGDLKGAGGTRQLNVMRAETLVELNDEGRHAKPGEMGEQLVIAGLDPVNLAEGTQVRLGESAVIEIGIPRTGCVRFEHIQGTSRKTVEGRLVVLAQVIASGEIAVGDRVVVLEGPRDRRLDLGGR